MGKTFEEFQQIQDDFTEKIQDNNDIPIVDGIINCEKYANAKTKILWVLKEANSTKSWDYQHYLSIENIEDKKGKKDDILNYEIFRRILYASYGLINEIEYSCIPLAEKKSVYQIGEEIAYINIKKTGGDSESIEGQISNAYKINEELLLKQIKEYEPNILIFGNTLKYFDLDELKKIGWDLSENNKQIEDNNTNNTHFYPISKDKLCINAYHPSYWVVGREIYCSEIINAGLKWREMNK